MGVRCQEFGSTLEFVHISEWVTQGAKACILLEPPVFLNPLNLQLVPITNIKPNLDGLVSVSHGNH